MWRLHQRVLRRGLLRFHGRLARKKAKKAGQHRLRSNRLAGPIRRLDGTVGLHAGERPCNVRVCPRPPLPVVVVSESENLAARACVPLSRWFAFGEASFHLQHAVDLCSHVGSRVLPTRSCRSTSQPDSSIY
ncbi:hypothetical protein MRX96_017177 [Rhipicephalus microplus]